MSTTRRRRYITAADLRPTPAASLRPGDLVYHEFDLRRGRMLYPVKYVGTRPDGTVLVTTPGGRIDCAHAEQRIDAYAPRETA